MEEDEAFHFKKLGDIPSGQDGAIWAGFLFRFDEAGHCRVVSFPGLDAVSEFDLDALSFLTPHCNSVCFGGFYEETDEFPLLYANVYNAYQKDADRQEGTCCVYRLMRSGSSFRTKLLQVIRIGFVNEPGLWRSESSSDIRPYGNFVADAEGSTLYVFTMIDDIRKTRIFAFDLPGIPRRASVDTPHRVVLGTQDIRSRFDIPYTNFMQGAAFYKGMLLSTEGGNHDPKNPAALWLVDVRHQEEISHIDLVSYSLGTEPEFIDVYNGSLYFSDCYGSLYQLSIPTLPETQEVPMKKMDVAAYIWPAYTGDEGRTRIFWPDGYGEWETVKEAKAQYPGHQWPRKPLWGYVNEADPYVMEMEIEAAVDHGVNVFIYDWYWYDNRPFLENCLNDGFLKAKNRSKMKFYLMWANHDVSYGWDRRISEADSETVIWKGTVTSEQFRFIGKRWLEKYFTLPEYYTIGNKPVISIYDLQNFIDSFGSIEATKTQMDWLNEEAKAYGFDGIHFQYIKFGMIQANLTGFDGGQRIYNSSQIVNLLPFSSVTHYQFVHFADMNRDYTEIMEDVRKEWAEIAEDFTIPYHPHVSIGWDNTPRYRSHTDNVVKNNPPEAFEAALVEARALAEKTDAGLVTINSWNEWTETSYLQPDDLYGYGYLQAVKKVFKDN